MSRGIFGPPIFAAEQQRDFNIPAGPADSAVRQFVEQAGMSVIYEAGRLNRFKTRAIKGKYEPAEALRKLLQGSGLVFSFTNSRFISVNPQRGRVPSGLEDRDLPEVEVGACSPDKCLGLPAGVNVETITAGDLSRQGFTTIPDWVRSLTQNQGAGANEDTRNFLREAPTNVAYGSGLNLYGIGQRATLVLVNGRRLAPSGSAGSFTDVSNIPISAIDHIDLISDGASTIYGADAVGGIVNFVLRDSNSSPLTTASFGHLTRGSLEGSDFSQSYSRSWDRWRTVLGVEYYFRGGLHAQDRKQATSDLTLQGGSNFNTLSGNPGSILAGNQLFGIPAGQNGTSLTAGDLLPAPNLYDRDANTWILPQQKRLSGLASVAYDFADGPTVSFDSLLSQRRVKTENAPLSTTLSVPSTNPFNPLKGNPGPIAVLYDFGKDLGRITERGTVDSGQFTLGLNQELHGGWNLQATAGYTYETQLDSESNLVDFDKLAGFLATSEAAKAFNPFGDGSHTNPDTLAAIRADGTVDYKSSFTTAGLKTSGSIPFLPARPMAITAGYDYRVQSFRSALFPVSTFAGQPLLTNRGRTLNAVYLQSSTPVWGGLRSGSPFELTVSGGMRYEHFNDVGSAFTPSFGLAFETAPGLSFTASWARLFRPPNLPDLNESINYAAALPIPDQNAPSGYTTALVLGGNNADLSSETAHSWMLGLKFSPPAQPQVSLDLQYFNIVSLHQILPTQLLPQTLFSDPRYSYLYTRNVTPPALANICSHTTFFGSADQCQGSDIGAIVDLRLRSAETLKTDGIDLRTRYGLDTRLGEWSLKLQGTYILHFGETQAPGGELISYRNTAHNPIALRLRGVFGWENSRFFVSPAINLQGSYKDTDSAPSRSVGSWTTWDLVMGYKTRALENLTAGGTTISLRAFNVFNKQPPFLNNGLEFVGYDQENADLLGRRISLKIEQEW